MMDSGASPEKLRLLAIQAFEGVYAAEKDRQPVGDLPEGCFFQQQFKRTRVPDGPKVGSVSLSPRGDWRMPSDANRTLWQG